MGNICELKNAQNNFSLTDINFRELTISATKFFKNGVFLHT